MLRDEDVETFWRDGVVCLRGVLPADWTERLALAVEDVIAASDGTDLSAMASAIDAGGGAVLRDAPATGTAAGAPRGRFFAGTDHWRKHQTFRAFALESPLPRIVAELLRSRRVTLYEDSLLVKEPGTSERTAFHQDMAYFHVTGRQVCTTWCPLDDVTLDSGAVQYVRGSHLWQTEFKPNLFVSTAPIPGTEGETVPDVAADPDRYDLVWFETGPGDVVVHHARTIHGAPGNASATRRRRAISVRYCGDDARFHRRPGAPLKPWQEAAREGDVLGSDDDPVAYAAPA
ncbi:phytanoyl-CoA dioxygenase family protein [Candidatus Binatia bacterium]|jgi:ectoine hydroxylase-related dioxygenase (phytanoyl-CoA dioxygenase family)|nr:phytanoyl-CoA dioxygenase family protein [Candidatus Binatia bacterium]